MVWALTRVVLYSDDEDSEIYGEGAAFSVREEPDAVRAQPFDDADLDAFDEAFGFLDTETTF